jgi:hypothetical protein
MNDVDFSGVFQKMDELTTVMNRITANMQDISLRSQLNTDVREMREIDGS